MNTAFFVVTTDCTRSCPYCFYITGHQSRVSTPLDPDEALRAVETIARIGVDTLILTGGDPLLRPDLEEIISHASALGLFVLLLTNGDLLDEERIESLIRSGLPALSLSIDTLTEDRVRCRKIRPGESGRSDGPKGVKKALVKLALRSNLQVSAITAVTKKSLAELEELLSFSQTLSVGHLFGPAYIPRNHPSFDTLSLHAIDSGARDRFHRFMERWAEVYGTAPYVRLIQEVYTGESTGPGRCDMGSSSLVVNAEGTVLPCFHREDLPCGNARTDRPEEIIDRLRTHAALLRDAPCFGEHCLTLFTTARAD